MLDAKNNRLCRLTDGEMFSFQGIKETALHLAVRLEERSSLALVDFLCQNRSDKKESVSHLCEQDLALDRSAGGSQRHLIVLSAHYTATVWRREQQKETQLFTTASCITSQSL